MMSCIERATPRARIHQIYGVGPCWHPAGFDRGVACVRLEKKCVLCLVEVKLEVQVNRNPD